MVDEALLELEGLEVALGGRPVLRGLTGRLDGRVVGLLGPNGAGKTTLLKALAGPFPDTVFCPTGGITLETAPEFLALPNVACVGGSWLTPKAAIERKDWDTITRLARAAAELQSAP